MSETMNPRQAYGEALVALGARDSRVVALDADLSKSTMSCLFQQAYRECCDQRGGWIEPYGKKGHAQGCGQGVRLFGKYDFPGAAGR